MRCLLFVPLALAILPAAAQDSTPGRITVIGHATIEAAPDFATVLIGVTTRAPTAAAALGQNSAAASRVIALAKREGVPAEDLGTGAVSLAQAFRNVRGPNGSDQQPDGYQANNTVTLRLADLAKLGEVVRQAVDEGGANRIDGISFGLKDAAVREREAAAAATREAQDRARAIVEAAGAKLGEVELIASPPRGERSIVPMRELRMAAAPAPAPARAVPIEAGTVSVSADVEITWRIVAR